MTRPLLDERHLHPAIRERVARYQHTLVSQAQQAVRTHAVVVLGMAQNPFVRKARRLLTAAGIDHHYLGRGSYFSGWRERSALKMWTGWPTFPMVFVRGVLVGGASDVERLIASGELQRLMA